MFNAGPAAIEALNAGAIDATYIGPNPAINSFVKSKGESISIIAGAASGGAQLVVKPEINSAADLKGKTLASPQLGGTQDVALRAWLGKQGYKTIHGRQRRRRDQPHRERPDPEAVPGRQARRRVAARAVGLPSGAPGRREGPGGREGPVGRSLTGKPGEFPTTILIVNKKFAAEHPQTVEALLKGHVEAVNWLNDTPPPRRPPSSTPRSSRPPARRCRRTSSTGR